MELFQEIAFRLKDVRKDHKISRKKLSMLLDVKEKTIESYEYGKRKPTFEYIEKISKYFNLHPSYLLGSNDTVYMKPKLIKLIPEYMKEKNLSEKEMAELFKMSITEFKDILNKHQFSANEILDIANFINLKPSELGVHFYDESRFIENRYYDLEVEGKTLKELGIEIDFPLSNELKIEFNQPIDREKQLEKSKETHIKEINEILPLLSYEFIVQLKSQIEDKKNAKNNILD